MVSLFDKIRILLGMKAINTGDYTEPVVDQSAGFQVTPLPDNKVYYGILRNAPEVEEQAEEANPQASGLKHAGEPQVQAGELDLQSQELRHASELEQLKHYADLAKQNKLEDDELKEDWS